MWAYKGSWVQLYLLWTRPVLVQAWETHFERGYGRLLGLGYGIAISGANLAADTLYSVNIASEDIFALNRLVSTLLLLQDFIGVITSFNELTDDNMRHVESTLSSPPADLTLQEKGTYVPPSI